MFKFVRNISVELSLPVKERTEDGSVFIANCRAELDRLIEQSPDIPEDIVNAFVKRFPEPGVDASGNPTNEYDFFRPEILDIKPISIYRDKEDMRLSEPINRFLPTIGAGVYYHESNWYLGLAVPNILRTDHYDDVAGGGSVATERMHYFVIDFLIGRTPYSIQYKNPLIKQFYIHTLP